MKTTEQEILEFCEATWGIKDYMSMAAKLAEETGEIAGACCKMPEWRATVTNLEEELGDALIVLSQFAAVRGTTLKALRANRFEEIKRRELRPPAG